jgi:hypothetical protein
MSTCLVNKSLRQRERRESNFCPEALCHENPYIAWNIKHNFWSVRNTTYLPPGYAPAEDAQLPCQVENGVITVTTNRTLDDGQQYIVAEHNHNFFMELEGEPITLIEWMDGEIRQIHTESQRFWCGFTKQEELLVECSDNPVEDDYWLSVGVKQPEIYGDRAKQVPLPEGKDLLKLKKQLESARFCDRIFWCEICKDDTYEDDYGYSECRHIVYIDSESAWGGIGYTEEISEDSYKESFRELAKKQEDLALIEALKTKNTSDVWAFTQTSWELCDELEPARAYLRSLDDDTPEGFEQALKWLLEK